MIDRYEWIVLKLKDGVFEGIWFYTSEQKNFAKCKWRIQHQNDLEAKVYLLRNITAEEFTNLPFRY